MKKRWVQTTAFSVALVMALVGKPASAAEECRVIERAPNGERVIECDDETDPLPLCGSEFDTGERCLVPPNRRSPIRPPPAL